MKVCIGVIPPKLSLAMHRVRDAMARYKPEGVELVTDPGTADVQVLHCIGAGSVKRLAVPLGRAVIVQYCYHTTEDATPGYWAPVWDAAKATISYYDLPGEAGIDVPRFLRTPLGVDTEVFRMSEAKRWWSVMTSGYLQGRRGEAVEEVWAAAERLNQYVHHLGPALPAGVLRPAPASATDIADDGLATLYSQSRYVASLRYTEGFELPALEGYACGARPILFDLPCYRHWFDGMAEFVPVLEGEPLVKTLTEVLAREPVPVSDDERREKLAPFRWEDIMAEWWGAVVG